MVNDNFKSLENLITAIEESDFDKAQAALNAGKANGCKNPSIVNLKNKDKKTPLYIALEQANPDLKIIKLLLENGSDQNVENSNGETALCLAIRNKESKEILDELLEGIDLNYRYNGPFDNTKQIIRGDSYLQIAARARNVEAFLFIFIKSVEADIPSLEYNEDHENPLHIAAKMGILPIVVKEMFNYLKSPDPESKIGKEIKHLNDSIKKAREAGNNEDVKANQKELKKVEGKLESNKNYIRNALNSKCALSQGKRTPLDWVSKDVKNEIKETAGITDSFLCNKKFHLALQIASAMACIAALCLSLYLLYLTSQAFALSSVATMAFGGFTYFATKACFGLHDLYSEGSSVQGVEVIQIAEESSLVL